MARARAGTPRRTIAAFGSTCLLALSCSSASADSSERTALLVNAESAGVVSQADQTAASRAVSAALDDAAISYRVSPVSLEQLALALGCDPALDACLVRIAREVASGTLMVRRLDASADAPGPRLSLVAVSGEDGKLYRSELPLGGVPTSGTALAAAPVRSESARARTLSPRRAAASVVLAEGAAPSAAEPAQMTPLARTVGASAVAAATVLTIAGTVEAIRGRRSSERADAVEPGSPQAMRDVSALRDDAGDHARLARGVLGTAGVLAVSGTLALIWHKFHGSPDAAQTSALQLRGGVVRGGALIAWRGQWGGVL